MSQTIKAACPKCGYVVDDASMIDEEGLHEPEEMRPEAGNVAVCINCAGVAFYADNEDESLGLRELTTEEKVELFDSDELVMIRAKVLMIIGKWGQS